jgi:hypothetical protein
MPIAMQSADLKVPTSYTRVSRMAGLASKDFMRFFPALVLLA